MYDRLLEWQRIVKVSDSDPPASMSLLAMAQSNNGTLDDYKRAKELSKARNALYARRAYQKRKAKEEELELEVQHLETNQAALWADNKRLELLYQEAMAIVCSLKDHDK